jgi:membrane fusion protein (multidrug efflux system)
MRVSIFALLLLLVLGGAGYWLQNTGRLQAYLPSSMAEALSPAAGKAQKPGGSQGQGQRQGGGNRGPIPVEVASAQQVRLSDDITAIGSLESEASVDIAPETSGRIEGILFKDGDRVEEGAVLFRLDDDLMRAQLADAEAKLALAEANFKRNETLRQSRTVAQSVYEASATELALARSAIDLVKVQLSKLEIRAPFSGSLGFSAVSPGAFVQAGTALVHLEKIDRLRVSFSVPELDFSRLAIGQQVSVTADAVPGESFTATIAAIDPLVDVSGRALRVRAELDNSAMRLRPGMLARVTVKGQSRDAVTVPEAAIVPRGEDTIVFVAAEDKAKEARVRTGKRAAGSVEILEGVEPGAQVVVAGNTRLSDGAAIKIRPQEVAN